MNLHDSRATFAAMTGVKILQLLVIVHCDFVVVHGAGWCEGIERGESCGVEHSNSVDAQTLHLKAGEQPRDAIWGKGMIEEIMYVDVLVAGGGSAGTSVSAVGCLCLYWKSFFGGWKTLEILFHGARNVPISRDAPCN
jgi:hypothetical protein